MDIGSMRFPAPLSVTELNEYVKELLDLNPPLTDIYIKGEISNFKFHSSGHFYFTMKDEGGALKCVMFRSNAQKISFVPENGMKIIAHGRISAFVRDGAYQLYCDDMEPDGVGALYIAYEQLKRRLEAEGLFSESVKKPIPKIPSVVGVVTSPTGAAVRDIINVCGRRFPYAKILIYPALVQGEGAPDSVSAGIEYFNKNTSADVLIVGRGGGSIEDLWAFNTEKVARSVAASHIPVISAVGHETDFTICDFVADRRAPTPSAAAELAVPETVELKHKFNNIISRESAVLIKTVENLRERLERCAGSRALSSPLNTIDDRRMSVSALAERLENAENVGLKSAGQTLSAAAGRLNALNPLAVISRGYSAVFTPDGGVIKSASSLSKGDSVRLRLSDGEVAATVDKISLTGAKGNRDNG